MSMTKKDIIELAEKFKAKTFIPMDAKIDAFYEYEYNEHEEEEHGFSQIFYPIDDIRVQKPYQYYYDYYKVIPLKSHDFIVLPPRDDSNEEYVNYIDKRWGWTTFSTHSFKSIDDVNSYKNKWIMSWEKQDKS